ncbi:MAG: outer membrane beta-barrel protein [bacterium]
MQSNTVQTTILAFEQLTLTPDHVISVPPSSKFTLIHYLTNTGNATTTYVISQLAQDNTGANYPLVYSVLDVNKNGVYDLGEPIVGNCGTVTLAPAEVAQLLVTGIAPSDITLINSLTVKITATSQLQGAVASNTDKINLMAGVKLTLGKVAQTLNPIPGQNETYAITGINSGSTAAEPIAVMVDGIENQLVLFTDAIPANTDLATIPTTSTGMLLYHVNGTASGRYVSTPPADLSKVDTVAVGLLALQIGDSFSFSLTVKIHANAAGAIDNTARIDYLDPSLGVASFTKSPTVHLPLPTAKPVITYYSDATFTVPVQITHLGSPLYLQIDAASLNTNVAAIDQFTITITSTLTGDVETYTAIETGPNTGIFRVVYDGNTYAVPTRDVAKVAAVKGDRLMSTTPNDKLIATFTDLVGVTAEADIIVDPYGVAFDSRTNLPVAGVKVILVDVTGAGNGGNPGGPATVWEVDGVTPAPSTFITGVDGEYRFPRVRPSTYKLVVTPPNAFSFPSKVPFILMDPQWYLDNPGSLGGNFVITTFLPVVRLDIPLDSAPPAGLMVQKTASRATIERAELLDYTINVRNNTGIALTSVVLDDILPFAFMYQRGTAQLDGAPLADPAGNLGPALRFTLPNMAAGAEYKLTYRILAGPAANTGVQTNKAHASGTTPYGVSVSNVATASVRVYEGVFTDKSIIIGKVFIDSNHNRVQDDSEIGIPGVRIFMEDGTYVITDTEGKYSFYGIRPVTHVLRIDKTSLPKGSELVSLSVRNAGDPASVFVIMKRAELYKANFAIEEPGNETMQVIMARKNQGEPVLSDAGTHIMSPITFDARPQGINDTRGLPASSIQGDDLSAANVSIDPNLVPKTYSQAALENRARELSNVLGFVDIKDGDLQYLKRINVLTKGSWGAKIRLAVNGKDLAIPKEADQHQYGCKQLQLWLYRNVELMSGDNTLTLSQYDNNDKQLGNSITINTRLVADVQTITVTPVPDDTPKTNNTGNTVQPKPRIAICDSYIPINDISVLPPKKAGVAERFSSINIIAEGLLGSNFELTVNGKIIPPPHTTDCSECKIKDRAFWLYRNVALDVGPNLIKLTQFDKNGQQVGDVVSYTVEGGAPAPAQATPPVTPPAAGTTTSSGTGSTNAVAQPANSETKTPATDTATPPVNNAGNAADTTQNVSTPNQGSTVQPKSRISICDSYLPIPDISTLPPKKAGVVERYSSINVIAEGLLGSNFELTINGKTIAPPNNIDCSECKVKGRAFWVYRNVALDVGSNLIKLTQYDKNGQQVGDVVTYTVEGISPAPVNSSATPPGPGATGSTGTGSTTLVAPPVNSGVNTPGAGSATGTTSGQNTSLLNVLQHRMLSFTNELGFVDLKNGDVLLSNQTPVVVKGMQGVRFSLTINGVEIPETQVGERNTLAEKALEVWTYIGIKLQPGDNELKVQLFDLMGNQRAVPVVIHVRAPGDPEKLLLEMPSGELPADGGTRIPVKVSLVDKNGLLVGERIPISLNSAMGKWDVIDLNDNEPGAQLFMEKGSVTYYLVSPRESGNCQVTVTSGQMKTEGKLSFVPYLPPLFMNAMIDARYQQRSLSADNGLTPLPDDMFEDRTGESGFNGRMALYLKGKIASDSLLTMSYDSQKNTKERLFADIQPDYYYPMYGDAGARGYDAQSTSPLYMRIDQKHDYIQYSDFNTNVLDATTALGAYNRSLTGVSGHYEFTGGALQAYASRNSLSQVVDEIAARGISGPYRLSATPIRENSELVEIITRDRNQPAVIIKREGVVRFSDYTLDAITGELMFRTPLASYDDMLNPRSIRVSYEVDRDGVNEHWVTGINGNYKILNNLTVSGNLVRDDNPADANDIRSAALKWIISGHSSLEAEIARTHWASAGTGYGMRANYNYSDSALSSSLSVGSTDNAFQNQMASLSNGRLEMNATAAYKLTPQDTLLAEALHTEDKLNGGIRTGVQASLEHIASPELRYEIGIRHAVENSPSPTPSVDPGTSIDFTSIRAKVTETLPTSSIYGEYEQSINNIGQQVLALGGDYSYATDSRIYARHEFISSLNGRYTLNDNQTQQTTVYGLDTKYSRDGSLFSEYRVRDAISGRDAEAAIGLHNNWRLNDGWRMNSTFERVQSLNSGSGNDTLAATIGADLTGSDDWKATTRAEYRTDSTMNTFLHTMGLAYKCSPEWTMLGKTLIDVMIGQGTSTGNRDQERAMLGFAYRPTENDNWNALLRYEYRHENDSTTPSDAYDLSAHILSADMNYQPRIDWDMNTHIAAKIGHYDQHGIVSDSNGLLLGQRITCIVTNRLELSLLGRMLTTQGTNNQYGLGAEVGMQLRDGLWVNAGYNISGFHDTDLAGENYTDQGFYIGLKCKFDESILSRY